MLKVIGCTLLLVFSVSCRTMQGSGLADDGEGGGTAACDDSLESIKSSAEMQARGWALLVELMNNEQIDLQGVSYAMAVALVFNMLTGDVAAGLNAGNSENLNTAALNEQVRRFLNRELAVREEGGKVVAVQCSSEGCPAGSFSKVELVKNGEERLRQALQQNPDVLREFVDQVARLIEEGNFNSAEIIHAMNSGAFSQLPAGTRLGDNYDLAELVAESLLNKSKIDAAAGKQPDAIQAFDGAYGQVQRSGKWRSHAETIKDIFANVAGYNSALFTAQNNLNAANAWLSKAAGVRGNLAQTRKNVNLGWIYALSQLKRSQNLGTATLAAAVENVNRISTQNIDGAALRNLTQRVNAADVASVASVGALLSQQSIAVQAVGGANALPAVSAQSLSLRVARPF